MKRKYVITGLFLLLLTFQVSAQTTRLLKGKVTSNQEALIGASVFENENKLNQTLTDANGEFILDIPQQKVVILYVSYGHYDGGFYVKIKEIDKYVIIDLETKKARRQSKRVIRKHKILKRLEFADKSS